MTSTGIANMPARMLGSIRCVTGERPRLSSASICSVTRFFFNDTATTEIYTTVHTLSLHDALPIYHRPAARPAGPGAGSQLGGGRSEEHTSELQSRTVTSYAVFCLKKKKKKDLTTKNDSKKSTKILQVITL